MRPGSYFYQRRSHLLFHLVVYLGGVVVLFLVLRHLAPILSPIFAAMGIAYMLDPLVDRLERRGIPRMGAVVLIMLGFAIVVTAAIALFVPLVASDAKRFAADVPALVGRASAWLRSNLGLDVPSDSKAALEALAKYLREAAAGARESILGGLGSAASGVLRFLGAALEVLLVPVFAFYFLLDWDRIISSLEKLIPPRHRTEVVAIARDIDKVVSSWVRGQLTVVAIQVVLYPIALYFVGIHLAVPIGVIAGLLTFIPYVGTFVGFTLAAGLALAGWNGWGPLVGVAATFLVLHLFESIVLTPKLVGKKVGIGEAGALFAAIAGAELLGFVGVMLAIPLAASLAVVVRRVLKYYEDSDFFTEEQVAVESAESTAPEESSKP